MKTVACVLFLLASAPALALANLSDTYPLRNQQATRACIFPSGGWAIVNCSNAAAAASSQLNQWSRYVIQCGVDSYFATGTSAVAADANDGWLPAGAWLEFMTTDTVRYASCLNIGSDSDCRILECQ